MMENELDIAREILFHTDLARKKAKFSEAEIV